MLYTTSESTHTNTNPVKGKSYKSRTNNKLAVHSGILCVNILGEGFGGGGIETIEKFFKIKNYFFLLI